MIQQGCVRWVTFLAMWVTASLQASWADSLSAATAARLEEEVPALLQSTQVASVSLAVVVDGELQYKAAFGQAGAGRIATTETVYNVASLAKPLTTALTLRLIAEGKLGLDDSLSQWWVDPDLVGDARATLLTPRLILSHQSGFPNWRDDKLAFQFTPGTDFGYSGEGFEYLAHALSAARKQSFAALMKKHVLKPLNMRHSTQTSASWLTEQMAIPFDAEGKALKPQIASKALASDDLYTTASDYARFLISLMQSDNLPSALHAEQGSIQVDRRKALCHALSDPECPSVAGFGLGWEVFELGAHRYWMHTGSDAGTFALAYFSPDQKSGLVLLTNSSNGASVVLPILDLLELDPAYTTWLRYLSGEAKQ